jgi:thiamine-phosphate pyrophosphorylase
VVCDAETCARAGWSLVDFAAACLDGGATLLQIRAKQAAGQWLLDVTAAVVERARVAAALVIVNDRADIARLAGAGGVHVGQSDLRPEAIRRITGPNTVVGLSTHTADQYRAAKDQRVDYLAIGPVFATATKSTGHEPVGLAGVSSAAASSRLPFVAIGGITLERAPALIEAGARSVAVISDLLATGDPAGRVRAYLRALA